MVSNLPLFPHSHSLPLRDESKSKSKVNEPTIKEVAKDALNSQSETLKLTNLKDKIMPAESSEIPTHINPFGAIERVEDEALGEELERWFASDMVEIPPSDPFTGAQVLIFKDDYQKKIPSNGMRESEWKQVSNWISELRSNAKIGSLELHGDEAFKDRVIDSLISLCGRSLGRELLGKVINLEHPCHIHQQDDLPTAALMVPRHPEAEITVNTVTMESKVNNWQAIDVGEWNFNVVLNPLITTQIYVGTEENRRLAPMDFHILLAHELIHAVHASMDPKAFFTRLEAFDPTEYHNPEERMTITGSKTTASTESIKPIETVKDAEDDWSNLVVEDNTQWDPMSENGLRSVMGFYTRSGHDGSMRLTNPDLSQVNPGLAEAMFRVSVNTGNVKDMEELLAHGWMKHVPSAEWVLLSAAQGAAQLGQLQSLEKLLSLGVDPSTTNVAGQNLLHLAAFSGHPNVVDHLITAHKQDPNQQDRLMQTPLWLATVGFMQLKGEKKTANRADFERIFSALLKQKGSADASILESNSALGILLTNGELQFAQLFRDYGVGFANSEEKIKFLVLMLDLVPVSFSDEAKEFIVKNHLLDGLTIDSQTVARLVATAIVNDREIRAEDSEKLGIDLDLSKLDAQSRETILATLIHSDKKEALELMRTLKLDLVSPLSNGQSPREYAQEIGAVGVAEELSKK